MDRPQRSLLNSKVQSPMGMSFNVAFKKKVPPYGKLGGDNMALGASYQRLDKVATARGLAGLEQFVSIDPEEAAEMSGLDPEDLGLPPLEWFDAGEGLAAVNALSELLRAEPKAMKNGPALLADLEKIGQELAAAKKAKIKFHFCLLD